MYSFPGKRPDHWARLCLPESERRGGGATFNQNQEEVSSTMSIIQFAKKQLEEEAAERRQQEVREIEARRKTLTRTVMHFENVFADFLESLKQDGITYQAQFLATDTLDTVIEFRYHACGTWCRMPFMVDCHNIAGNQEGAIWEFACLRGDCPAYTKHLSCPPVKAFPLFLGRALISEHAYGNDAA